MVIEIPQDAYTFIMNYLYNKPMSEVEQMVNAMRQYLTEAQQKAHTVEAPVSPPKE